jgi:hypothetical protein
MFAITPLRCIAAVASTLALMCGSRSGAAECSATELRYEQIPLGTGGSATELNDRGEVIGSANLPDGSKGPFVWQCASGNTAFAGEGTPLFINDRGQIVSASPDNNVSIWSRAHGTQLIGEGTATSLNDWGDVTLRRGEFYNGEFFLWTASAGAVALHDLTGRVFARARVNNRRQVGGYVVDIFNPDEGTGFAIWSARQGIQVNPTFRDFFLSSLVSFNDRGEFLVTIEPDDGFDLRRPRIFYPDGSSTAVSFNNEFEQWIHVSDLNNQGQVIGSDSTFAQIIPVLSDPILGIHDLNTLTFGHPTPDWGAPTTTPVITEVNAINEWSWIVGAAAPNSYESRYPVLLVPVPSDEPYYRNLARLRGPRLCAALASLKIRAVAKTVRCGIENTKP